ncbi:MAG: polysaccharide deacetylase family protein [Candidatus Kryptoniota bacterium]
MKILHIAPYSPMPPIFGGALRIFYILRGLAQRHDVTFVTFGTENDRELLKNEFGGLVRQIHLVDHKSFSQKHRFLGIFYAFWRGQSFFKLHVSSTKMQETLDRLFKNEKYDLVVIEFAHMGQFRLDNNVVKILDEHNVEYSNLRRMSRGIQSPLVKYFYFREQRKMFLHEIETCNMVDAIFVTSKNDGVILNRHINKKPMYVIPNGVDTRYFVPADKKLEPHSMVFIGTMDYVPNRDAMMYFLDEILPLVKKVIPDAKIYIVGKNPPDNLTRRSSNDVIVTGYVDDVRPYAWNASVYVVPLRMGSGTRLKILEGLAMKKAIVTTSIGCEGIDVKNGEHVVIADDPVLFAEKVIDLLLDEQKARTLGSNGHEMVTAKYNWDVIASSMNEAIASLFNEKNRVTDNVRTSEHSTKTDSKGLSNINHPTVSIKDTTHQIVETPVETLNVIVPTIKVLMYHRIIMDKDSHNRYSWFVTASQFRRHLELLDKWGYTCINFEDYSLFLKGQIALPKKPVILTFDDGYEEIYKYAFPIIREFGVRGTIFVIGERSIKSNVWDKPAGFESANLMNGDQIRELQKSGLEIGSHSMTHADLTKLTKDAAKYEIRRSKESLEDLIQMPVITFAYPYGSVNEELENMVRDAGYEYGCGTYSGSPRFTNDIYNIRRIAITNKANAMNFRLNILTLHEHYSSLKWITKQKVYQLIPGYSNNKRLRDTTAKDIDDPAYAKEVEYK